MTLRTYGWTPDHPDIRDHVMRHSLVALMSLPPLVDHRSRVEFVFDQKSTSSCTGNATAQQCYLAQPAPRTIPSRLFVYYNSRLFGGNTSVDSGASIRNSIKSVVRYGFPPETAWPFDPNIVTRRPTKPVYKLAKQEVVRAYSRVQQTASNIKACLAAGHTVNFGFSVYESFEDDAVAKTGIMKMPKPGERLLGGHAVLLVGYDDSKGRYIVLNSWGDDWGDKGFFYMPYDYTHNPDLADDFWVINAVT